jgi:hypothetical protein
MVLKGGKHIRIQYEDDVNILQNYETIMARSNAA